jgi:uncharacterized protein
VKLEGEQSLLRIHLSNFVKWRTRPLYEVLVDKARREHLAGATVLSGIAGFLGGGPLLGQHPRALQVERPVILEFVDQEPALTRFMELVEPMLAGHPVMVTLERAHVVHYRGGDRPGKAVPR